MAATGTTVGRITLKFTIANYRDVVAAEASLLPPEQVRRVTLRGVVDTGATRLVLPPSGQATVRFADRRTALRAMVKNVSVELLGRQGVFTAVVEPGRDTTLIGAIVMEDLDLLVDRATQTLRPRDPDTIISEVE